MPADDLFALVEDLRAPYGLEKSVKFAPGAMIDDRCLVSVHRSALGSSPAERLADIADKLGMPADFSAKIASALEGADIVHFGHEAGPRSTVKKIYFEYAEHARRAMARGEPALVHLAFKWTPGLPGVAATQYTWSPSRTGAEAESKLRALLPTATAPRALRGALSLLARVAALAETGDLLMMEVEEPGLPRRSCDLNVYDAGLRVRDVDDLIEAVAKDFAVPSSRRLAVFGGAGDRALGHLSAGVGRDGEEFVTFYYGIEAHGPRR